MSWVSAIAEFPKRVPLFELIPEQTCWSFRHEIILQNLQGVIHGTEADYHEQAVRNSTFEGAGTQGKSNSERLF